MVITFWIHCEECIDCESNPGAAKYCPHTRIKQKKKKIIQMI